MMQDFCHPQLELLLGPWDGPLGQNPKDGPLGPLTMQGALRGCELRGAVSHGRPVTPPH